MKQLLLFSFFLCSTLLAKTVPNELTFYGENLTELNRKRIAGDEVAKVHHFKLSKAGWDISYRADGIGSLLGISNWMRLTYTGSVIEINGDNGEPKTIKRMQGVTIPENGSESEVVFLNVPNPDYKEHHLKYKEFVSSDDKIVLRVYSDGDAMLRIIKDDLFISQYLKTSEGKGFMLGVYDHNQ